MRSHVGPVSKGVLLLAGGLLSLSSFALDPLYFQGQAPKAEDSVTAYGTDLFGDQFNPFNGTLQFQQTDLTIKGNNALPVTLTRADKPGVIDHDSPSQLSDWHFLTPRIGGTFTVDMGWRGSDGSYSRCSKYWSPATEFVISHSTQYAVFPTSFWHGTFLEVPGQSVQELLQRTSSYTDAPQNGGSYPITTKENWAVGCLSSIQNGSGEGFYAISPEGVRYTFDWLGSRNVDGVKIGTTNVPRQELYLYASLVTDRFGNWVKYTYDPSYPNALKTITSSDSRTITVTNSSGQATSATDGTRTVSYGYSGYLSTVTLPDSTQWHFSLASLRPPGGFGKRPTDDCDDGSSQMQPGTFTGSVTHPSGATAVFTMQFEMFSFYGAPTTCNPSDGIQRMVYPPVSVNLAVTSKVITGPGLPTMTWSYGYQDVTSSNPTFRAVTVSEPTGFQTRQRFGNTWHVNEGKLLGEDKGWDGTNAVRSTAYTYDNYAGQVIYPQSFGTSLISDSGDFLAATNMPVAQTSIVQQGQTFSSVAGAYDKYARPTVVTKSGTGGSRQETTTYFDDLTKWVLGQTGSVTSGAYTLVSNTYNAQDLPTATQEFGVLKSTQTYNGDGTLASKADGAGHTTYFTNYMRGIAQNVSYPTGATESGVVNNIGRVTSFTDASEGPTGNGPGYTTGYGYDAAGRLASITPPTGFTATTLVFAPVSSIEYGLDVGHWRRTITKGNATTVSYYDALWRPVMTRTFDAANQAGTRKVIVKGYDADSKVTFQSYPQRDIASFNVTSPGSRMQYDALDRLTTTTADSELGNLVSTNAYLPGFQTQNTNARGYATTQTLWALDDPDKASISAITAPQGVQVGISRDVFGKPTSITRNGVSRQYVYDSGQRLCKTVSPETGATVQTYDAAGNMAWQAVGQALPDPANCNLANVTAGSTITFGYDQLGQLLSTTYGDGSPSITRTFWPDEKLKTIVSNGSTWSYTYNALRQISGETLTYASQTFPFTWTYDALGNLSSSTNPAGCCVPLNPNALGEPTTVGTYATAITFQPNGLVAGYTLGNGIVHSQSQTVRGLPLVNADVGVLSDQYTYDANGNVTAIVDQQQNYFGRTMTYDGLDRLTGVTAPNVWGAAAYTYDPVDNMTSVSSNGGARFVTLNYADGTNRLTGLTQSGSTMPYSYDAYGNISARGPATFHFDLGNRLISSSQGGGYVYDGLGRRIQVQSTDGSTRIQAYSQAGQLLWSTNVGGGRATSWTAYEYLAGKEIAEVNSATGTQYVHVDALGSPVAHTVAQTGPPTWALLSQTRFEAYGNVAQGTAPGPSTSLVGFTGHVQDAESNLVYMQQRYYDVASSRFLSVDPKVSDANTGDYFNVYEYAKSNPYRYTDPDGRQAALSACFGGPAACAIGLGLTVVTIYYGAKAVQDTQKIIENRKVDPLDSSGGAEHKKNARPSQEDDHQDGAARKRQDRGREKGDEDRDLPRKRPDGWKGPWPPKKPDPKPEPKPPAPEPEPPAPAPLSIVVE